MSEAHRALAARRLATILAYEEAGSRDAASVVDERQLSLPRFHSLLRAWRRERTLYALVPQARGRARGAAAPPKGLEVSVRREVEKAMEMAGDEDAPSRESIATGLHGRFGHPSLGTFRRMVARAMRDLERERAGGFGRRIVVDSAAIPLPLLAAGSEGGPPEEGAGDDRADVEVAWAVAAFCWDVATGRILGRALDSAPSTMALHAASAVDAAAALRALDPMGSAEWIAEVATTLPREADAIQKLRTIAELERRGAQVIRVHRGEGGELTKSFGARLGRLELRARFAANGFPGRTSRSEVLARYGRAPMGRDEALLALDREIRIHNEAMGPVEAATAILPGLVADRLDRVFAGF